MKNIFTKVFTLLLCAMIIFPCFTVTKAEAAEEDIYYCREALKALPDSDKLIFAYDKLCQGIESSIANIQIYNGQDNISLEEFQMVFDAYRRDHAEHFWLGNAYTYTYTSETITSVKPQYIMSGDELATAKLQFDSAMEAILSQLTPTMTEYEKEKKLHDILASKITYIEEENAHNAYGALVEGKAVCEGYAEALQCLLHKVGIQSLIITGSSKNPSTGTSEGHAWNMVKIDGEYYHTDLTWDDQGASLYYAYFNQTDAVILLDHVMDEPGFALPSCTATVSNYFTKEGNILTTYTTDSVGQMLKDNDLTVRFYIPSGKDIFINWFTSNIHNISSKAGVTGAYGYSYSSLGNEVIIIIDTCNHSNLTFVPKVDATCTENGNIAYYVCTCGKYFSDSQAKKEIIDKSLVTIIAGHVWTKEIQDSAHLRSEPASCAEYYTYFYGCEGCDGVSTDKYYTSKKTLPHTLTLVNRVEPTCSEYGKSEYYTCVCGKHFEDANGTKEITNLSSYGKINKTTHQDIDTFGRCGICGSFVEITEDAITIGLMAGGAIICFPILIAILRKMFRRKRR